MVPVIVGQKVPIKKTASLVAVVAQMEVVVVQEGVVIVDI